MKYIDAEKLMTEIERRLERYDPDYTNAGSELKELLSFVASLQQEQPSLPSNLDEAAKEYIRNYIPFDQCDSRDIIHTFKAGAEWMAGRGESIVAKIGLATNEIFCTIPEKTLDSLGVRAGDDIIIQIRKK